MTPFLAADPCVSGSGGGGDAVSTDIDGDHNQVAQDLLGDGVLNGLLEGGAVLENVLSSEGGDNLDEVLSPADDLRDVGNVLNDATELVDLEVLDGATGLLGGAGAGAATGLLDGLLG